MECRIQSMAESNPPAEANVPSGKVEAVCREWLIREDGVLAYKLQSEEIQHHYGHNKEKNQLVRTDIQEAKMVQRSEEEEAELVQQAYERMLLEQEAADALVAKQIQERLLQEELERQRQIEEEDKRIAFELQRREKIRLQKKREERELRQVEKVKAVQSNSTEAYCQSFDEGSPVQPTQEASTSPLDRDFTDLCLEPPTDLTEEERRRFREDQDAELAKFLQQQELKRRNPRLDDQLLAVEAQDRELAKALQEQERAKARRAKERAKQKALLQKQDPAVCNAVEEAQIHYAVSPIDDSETSPTDLVMKDNECYGFVGDYRSLPSPQVNNIAMVLDPTYTHKRGLADGQTSSRSSIVNTPPSSVQHSPNETLVLGQRGLSPEFFLQPDDDDDDAVAPPYMPIQGQRRQQTLEKAKKNKKYREGCKTQ